MKKRSFKNLSGLVFSILLIMTLSLWAAEPWKTKKSTEWTVQEALQVLNHSPWANTESVVTGMGSMDGQSTPGGMGQKPRSQTGGDDLNTAEYSVAWYSALPVRQAHARLASLNNRASEDELKEFLQPVTEVCNISIKGKYLKPFFEADKETAIKKTYLLVRGKEKIYATDYTPPASARSGLVVFHFPRSLNGTPVLNENDKEVEFGTEVGGIRVRSHFTPKKMIFEGSFTY
jgi:hypothetical protein